MHAVVMESLEEFLAGTLEPVERRAVETHLDGCAVCREELQAMEDMTLLFGSLRSAEEIQPGPDFSVRVIQKVSEQKAGPSWTSFFLFDPVWAQRMVVACAVLVIALGSYLVTSERQYASGPMPDAVMAQQTQPLFDSAPASDSMLVTLASYEH